MPYQKIDSNTKISKNFELLENALENAAILAREKDEKKRRNDLAFDLATDSIIHEQMLSAQEKRHQTFIQLKQEEERLTQREKDLKNQALIDQEQDEESLRQFEEYVAQWEKEKEMIFGEKESQKRKSEKDEKIQKYSQMRLKQIQNKVAQNENQKLLEENQMAQEKLEREIELENGKEKKMRLNLSENQKRLKQEFESEKRLEQKDKKIPQNLMAQWKKEDKKMAKINEEYEKIMWKRLEYAMDQEKNQKEKKIHEENEKKKRLEQESQMRLNLSEKMMAQWKRFQDAVVQAQEKNQKEEKIQEEKEKENLMAQWKEEDKKMAQAKKEYEEIIWKRLQKQNQWNLEQENNEDQEENVVIEVEESDKSEDEESLQDCDNKSDNELRLERFLEIQSKAFNDPKFSDFTIICGEKEFNVHRVILALHSDILLNHDQKSSSITLKDLDADLVEKMLKFMYSGKVEGLEKNAHDLFLLAKKFGVKELEKLCLYTITKKITSSNVLNCLRLAFRFDLNELKQNAIFYVCAHIQEVQETKEWEEFAKENGEIVAAILKSVSERRDFLVGQSQGPVIPMPQNQDPVISMSTNHCPPVPMPPVFVPQSQPSQNQPSQKPRRQTNLQALSKQVEKSQGLSGKMLHNPSLFNSLPQSQISQSQGQILPAPIPSINSFEELPPYLPFAQLPPQALLEQMPTQIPYNGPISQSQGLPKQGPFVPIQPQKLSVPKNQNSSENAEMLKQHQDMIKASENYRSSVSKNQGTSASVQDAENLKTIQDMMEAAKNAHRVFEAAELYKKSCSSPQISAPLIPLPNPVMYPVFQDQQKKDKIARKLKN